MLEIIIGQNASGKTLYLYNCIKAELEKNNTDFASNLNQLSYEDLKFNKKRIEILYDLIDTAEEIITNNKILSIKAEENFSKAFLEIMSILCKDVSTLFLDEPEQGLSRREIDILCTFIERANRTYKRVVIVTHCDLIIQCENIIIYSVQMSTQTNKLRLIEVPEDKKFEIID